MTNLQHLLVQLPANLQDNMLTIQFKERPMQSHTKLFIPTTNLIRLVSYLYLLLLLVVCLSFSQEVVVGLHLYYSQWLAEHPMQSQGISNALVEDFG